MMAELIIEQIKENGGEIRSKDLAERLKIVEQDALEILEYGESVGVFFNTNTPNIASQKEFVLHEIVSNSAIQEFQEFIDRFFGDMKMKSCMQVFTVEVQAQKFEKLQPFFYDKSGIFWLWNHEDFCWEITDDIDMLNMIKMTVEKDVNNSKLRLEILNALKQRGRMNIPKEIKPTWIQFRERIIDIQTNEEFKATPNYFVTNPILWRIGEEDSTPTFDKLFKEWVGEEHKEELYEVIAFCLAPSYFIQRLICLIGAGSNGKSTYLNILRKFIGNQNITSVSLDDLMKSRFAGAKLFRKSVCLIGETNFNTLQRTDFLKKLTGGDMVPGEFKNKNPFDFINYAKLVMASNSLPMTADKTDGFYRRWKIIDFPFKFGEKRDILSEIPEKEYENLAKKCLNILRRLWEERTFTNDGDFDDRRKRYEEKSNPVMLYIRESYEKDINSDVLFSEFYEGLLDFFNENGFRTLTKPTVTKQLKMEGFDISLATVNNVHGTFIYGIKKKDTSVQNKLLEEQYDRTE